LKRQGRKTKQDKNKMPQIPDAILDMERVLTAAEISIYNINAGPGGSLVARFYRSAHPDLHQYRFYIRSVISDTRGLYYLTIRKDGVSPPGGS
jgi:hypothetical protein